MNEKLVSGEFRPKCSKGNFVINFILDVCLIIVTVLFIKTTLNPQNVDPRLFIGEGILIFILDYIMLLSPYQQYPRNYKIELSKENSLEDFKLFYKNKPLNIQYELNEEGKFSFKEPKKRLECIEYENNKCMSNLTKRRILNYFTAWLKENELLAETK